MASRHVLKATKPSFWFYRTDRLKRMPKNAEQMLLIVGLSVKLLKCSGSLGSCANCCSGPFIVAFFLIQLFQWQTSFLWFMTVCHSHNLGTFSLGLVSVLSALPTSRSLAYTHTAHTSSSHWRLIHHYYCSDRSITNTGC